MIHPTAVIGSPPEMRDWQGGKAWHPFLYPGVRVSAFVTIDSGRERHTLIGARTFLMAHVHIGHDAIIGADCEIAPHTTICGHAEIGRNVRIGANACVRPYIKIADGARIGMGAVVVKDVSAGETWVGNPARPLVKPAPDELTESELEGWEYIASMGTR